MKIDVKLWVATHETKYGVDTYVFTSAAECDKARDEYLDDERVDEGWDFNIHTITIETENYT